MSLQQNVEDWLNGPTPLSGLHALIWQTLADACDDSEHPWNLGALTTVDEDASPQARTVVLRQVDSDAHSLDCFTDWRSPKCRQLENRNGVKVAGAPATGTSVCWLFYDDASKVQLRLQGIAVMIREGADWEQAWQQLPLHRRSAYLARETPGTRVPRELPPAVDHAVAAQPELGREHFTLIRTYVTSADWLYLRHAGHVRAALQYDESGEAQAHWCVP